MPGIVLVSVYKEESTNNIDVADFIRNEIRVMLQFARCGPIILICLLEFSMAKRQLVQ